MAVGKMSFLFVDISAFLYTSTKWFILVGYKLEMYIAGSVHLLACSIIIIVVSTCLLVRKKHLEFDHCRSVTTFFLVVVNGLPVYNKPQYLTSSLKLTLSLSLFPFTAIFQILQSILSWVHTSSANRPPCINTYTSFSLYAIYFIQLLHKYIQSCWWMKMKRLNSIWTCNLFYCLDKFSLVCFHVMTVLIRNRS